jgi:molecular chaperone HtpG
MLFSYDDKQFRSISDNDLGIETDKEKEEIKSKEDENKDLFAYMKETLKDKVVEVKLSSRLKQHPVCLTARGQISLDMEKTLNAISNQEKISAERVLEINPTHKVFAAIEEAFKADDKDKVAKYTKILYSQALLIEGLNVEDPVEYANLVCELMD